MNIQNMQHLEKVILNWKKPNGILRNDIFLLSLVEMVVFFLNKIIWAGHVFLIYVYLAFKMILAAQNAFKLRTVAP